MPRPPEHEPRPPSSDARADVRPAAQRAPQGPSRRAVIGGLGAGAAAAWVAPAILSVDAAAAATVAPLGTISGTVTSAGGGTPIQGASITLTPTGGGTPQFATTLVDGTYSFPDLEPGSYDVTAVAGPPGDYFISDSPKNNQAVTAGNTTTVNFTADFG